MKNNIGTNFRKIYDCENKSITRTPSELVSQRSKKKTITPEQTKATNKYMDCILCIIYRSKIKLLFLKKKSWNLKKNYIFVPQPRKMIVPSDARLIHLNLVLKRRKLLQFNFI